MQSSWGIFQGVPYCTIPQPHTGFSHPRQNLTWEHEGRVKRLTATCEKISPLVNFEFTWNWNLSRDFSSRIDCWVFWVSFDELPCRPRWLFCMADLNPTALLQVHDWLPQKLAPSAQKVTWANLPTQFDFWIKQVLDVPVMFPHIEIPLWKGMWKVSEIWENFVLHSYFLL